MSTDFESLFYMTRGSCFKALRLLTFLSLVSVFCAPMAALAVGVNSCDSVFLLEYAPGGRLQIQTEAKNLAEPLQTYAEIIKDIDASIAPLVAPKETVIEIGDAFAMSGFSGNDFSVYVGARPRDFAPFNVKANRNILVHEYGHAVFEKNLLLNSAEYRELRHSVEKLEADLAANDSLLNKLRKENPQGDAFENAKIESGRLKKLRTQLEKLVAIRYAYHEIFADVLLWARTGNPKAIREGSQNLKAPTKPHTVEDLLMRDLDAGMDPHNMQLWKENIYTEVYLKSDIYYVFLPVRWEIYALTKDKIHDAKYRASLPAKIFQVLLKNFIEDLKQNPKELGPNGFESVERLNEKIIRDLRQAI